MCASRHSMGGGVAPHAARFASTEAIATQQARYQILMLLEIRFAVFMIDPP